MKADLGPIAQYYSEKLAEHGATPRGVDWNGEESQSLRFEQLARLFGSRASFSVNDLGCGYGAFFDFLNGRYAVDYRGFDVSSAMIAAARTRFGGAPNARFFAPPIVEPADFGVASGIFNVRLAADEAGWKELIENTLTELDATCRHGFAFNCLTAYSDAEKMKTYLYYADPGWLFDLCQRKYSRHVALLHDYGLYEFTILVRKP